MGGIPERKVRRVMAKKDKNEFSYGASFLPEGEKKYSVIRWGWNGLNETDKIDTGQLTSDHGVLCDPPYMYPVKKAKMMVDFSENIPVYTPILPTDPPAGYHVGYPQIIAGFDKVIGMKWFDETSNCYMFSWITQDPSSGDLYVRSADLSASGTSVMQGSIVQFNVVTDPNPNPDGSLSGNIAAYTYDKKLLIYPDCYSVPYRMPTAYSPSSGSAFNTNDNPVPATYFSTVYQSRVFGANDNSVFASDYNSYAAYNLDTADDIASNHAWWSMSQSNTEANSNVTAVLTYDNHVVVFRKDYMQLVYNNKNPFRIVDVGNYGCDNNKSWTILNDILYFSSHEKVYAFTGGTPKDISTKMDFGDLTGAVLGSYRDTVWMQTNTSLYIYKNGVWSDVGKMVFGGADVQIVQFATLDYCLVALCDLSPRAVGTHSYALYYVDWDVEQFGAVAERSFEPKYEGTWWFETDLMALGKLDIRRVKKFSVLCEGKKNATVSVYLFPDDKVHDTDYDDYKVGEITFDEDGMKLMRILTRQFSSTMHKLRFAGTGYVKIYAAELKIAWGGDVYVEG